MLGSKRKFTPRVESLENIALLAALPGVPATSGLGSIGSVTNSDALALQQDSSGGSLEQYISEIEVLNGRRSNVKAYAASVVDNHQTTNFDLQVTAGLVGVTLPPGVALPTDIQDAQKVIAAVRGGNLDQVYLKVMQQINAQDVADDQNLTNTTQDTSVAAYASESQAYDQNHLQGARQLLQSPKSTYNPTFPTTSITTPTTTSAASSSDSQALQQDASGGYLEQFISQIEEQRGSRGDAQQYAQTVVGDHQVTNYDLIATGNATGVTIPAGITQASDIQDAKRVLAAARSGNLDKTYLSVMAEINATDVMNDQMLISSTTNSLVSSYAQETLSFDMMHLTGAQTLQAGQKSTYTPAG